MRCGAVRCLEERADEQNERNCAKLWRGQVQLVVHGVARLWSVSHLLPIVFSRSTKQGIVLPMPIQGKIKICSG